MKLLFDRVERLVRIDSMKIDFEIHLQNSDESPVKDGQINFKVPKDQEIRFKTLNIKNQKKLSGWLRDFAFTLMDKVEAMEKKQAS